MRWNSLRIYAADIGSIARSNFGWARAGGLPSQLENTSIDALVEAVAQDLSNGKPVALGIEAPMFVPVPEDYRDLGKKRDVDPSNRAWSAGAGAPVLATGIAQLGWIISSLAERVDNDWTDNVDVRWSRFSEKGGPGLFLWEAMVTGSGKKHRSDPLHNVKDAEAAVRAFEDLKSKGLEILDKAAQATPASISLVGAALASSLPFDEDIWELLKEVPVVVAA